MSEEPSTRSLEQTAADWLAAERELTAHPTATAETVARGLASDYEDGIRAASPEELRLAWEAARRAQALCEMGSTEWAEARSVSQLLRTEYSALTGHG
jgi:hypothetical protein